MSSKLAVELMTLVDALNHNVLTAVTLMILIQIYNTL